MVIVENKIILLPDVYKRQLYTSANGRKVLGNSSGTHLGRNPLKVLRHFDKNVIRVLPPLLFHNQFQARKQIKIGCCQVGTIYAHAQDL